MAFDLSRESELKQRGNKIYLLSALIRSFCFIDPSVHKNRERGEEPFAGFT